VVRIGSGRSPGPRSKRTGATQLPTATVSRRAAPFPPVGA